MGLDCVIHSPKSEGLVMVLVKLCVFYGSIFRASGLGRGLYSCVNLPN